MTPKRRSPRPPQAVTRFLGQLTARGLTITVFGVPITIALGPKP